MLVNPFAVNAVQSAFKPTLPQRPVQTDRVTQGRSSGFDTVAFGNAVHILMEALQDGPSPF